jgi:outer membrane biosynthesis protein TonB
MAAIIGPDGTPEQGSVRIVQGVNPAIDREALRRIRGASYWPACHDGQPVRARVAQPLDFCRFPPCRRGTD